MSYWGQEKKICPACSTEVLAAAVRCRTCGTTFESARPQNAIEFSERMKQKKHLPEVRRRVVWLFVFCVLPCMAPFAAVLGTSWYLSNREDVRTLPALYSGLCRVGLGIAVAQTCMVAFLTYLYALKHY